MIEARSATRDDPVERPCGRLPILDQFEDCELAEINTSEWYVPSARALSLLLICVGRVLFNPPLLARWRVKENPPYASCCS